MGIADISENIESEDKRGPNSDSAFGRWRGVEGLRKGIFLESRIYAAVVALFIFAVCWVAVWSTFLSTRAWAKGHYDFHNDALYMAEHRFLCGLKMDPTYPLNYAGLAEVSIEKFHQTGQDSYLAEALIMLERICHQRNGSIVLRYMFIADNRYRAQDYEACVQVNSSILV